jgi:hypothetical protein
MPNWMRWGVVAGALCLSACGLVDGAWVVGSTPTPEVVSQWASTATASSAFGFPDWSPNRATGAPEVDLCADDPRAWASARGNGVEWLQLLYARPVFAEVVRVYQTHGRGAISRVTLIDTEGTGHVVWEGVDQTVPCPGVLEIRVLPLPQPVATVRVDLDESRTGVWNQIDAVEMIGVP